MLPSAVRTVLGIAPEIEDLLALLASLSGRPTGSLRQELKEHLASRVFFLLLAELGAAPNFSAIRNRLQTRLRFSQETLDELSTQLADAQASVEAYFTLTGAGIGDLPYTMRRTITQRQRGRCAICGWPFYASTTPERTDADARPTLDHEVPLKLGGDQAPNLRITCGLCNRLKSSAIHIGVHGNVWIDDFVYGDSPSRSAFWTLVRDGRCTRASCEVGPSSGRLFVVRQRNLGPWVPDNCLTLCENHVEVRDALPY